MRNLQNCSQVILVKQEALTLPKTTLEIAGRKVFCTDHPF